MEVQDVVCVIIKYWSLYAVFYRYKWNVQDDDDDHDDEEENDDEDETNHNSANFEATTSRFCMVIDLNETYMMMMMMTTMMMMMMKMKLIITRPILKLQPSDFAW